MEETTSPIANFEIIDHPKLYYVLMVDLKDSTQYYNTLEALMEAPKYLNYFLGAIKVIINGGAEFWTDKPEPLDNLPEPIHWKFLGDGYLIIWEKTKLDDKHLVVMLNRLFDFKKNFKSFNNHVFNAENIIKYPTDFRMGMTLGYLNKIKHVDSGAIEFIGSPINLASRLQSYCKELGFIFSDLGFGNQIAYIFHWKRVIAYDIRSYNEIVAFVDNDSFQDLDEKIRESKFRLI